MDHMFKVHESYCWWINGNKGPSFSSPFGTNIEDYFIKHQNSTEELHAFSRKEIKKRKRRNSALDIDSCIENLSSLLSNNSLRFVVGKIKIRPPNFETPKGRSSSYIGVSKNGDNWQVLINCGKFKKYIGTFSSEKHAAITYDFYSICLHLSKAKTNFTYDSQLISEMVESYESNSKSFDASVFLNRV